ncbi:MAG: hypothetical protein KC800_15845 [Candidatus Eremiobacteraeota bacterium]|nr:hypothetical protein [Candidatus Eremiobacteraeota bacterium]
MRIQRLALLLLILILPLQVQAAPPEELLAKLIEIAEPDQVEAYSKLNLSPQQEAQLSHLARGYAPQFQEAKGQPTRLMGLVGQALADADKFLTPTQRPLIRKLIPRPHQWEKLRRLREAYAD